MNILITGARLLTNKKADNQITDIAIKQGAIEAIGSIPKDFFAEHTIKADGLLAIPGLVDLATYLRDPGFEYKATIESETKAAAASGVTTLCCMPYTEPKIDSAATVELIQKRAHEADFCKVLTIGAMTKSLAGLELSDMAALKEAGCVAVSHCLCPFADALVLRRAMEYAAGLDLKIFVQPFDRALAANGCAHEGALALHLGLVGIPVASETAFLSQCIEIAKDLGIAVHFCRLSCARSVELIANAQARGIAVSADVSAHQLFLSEEMLIHFDPNYHVVPPLRSEQDRDALREAIKDGTISAICSDHQPHDISAKLVPFPSSEPGISALETLLALTLRLVEENVVDLTQAIDLVTRGPAAILNWGCGTLHKGGVADLCLVDLNETWTLLAPHMYSSGTNSPFIGETFKGRIRYTICNGKLSYDAQ
ncbi:MAG: dihydroorotase [Chromatiales bacterium]|nr:dihydroorotase [Chromatiales bacterium]